MHYQKEARRSLGNSHRAPTKGEIILANHTILCAAVFAALVFASPWIIGTIVSVLYV